MAQPDPNLAGNSHANGFLTSWKEIAAHLGRSVRTVQRWEKELGLPVHRRETAGGEIVFARAGELDKWLLATETARERETQNAELGTLNSGATKEDSKFQMPDSRDDKDNAETQRALRNAEKKDSKAWKWVAVGSLAALVAGTGWVAVANGWVRLAPPQPASWRVEDNRVTVSDFESRQLFGHTFEFSIAEAMYANPANRPHLGQFANLDNDGAIEFVFLALEPEQNSILYVFNGDGSVRFTRRVTDVVRFGEMTFSPPYFSNFLLVTSDPDGTKSIWVRSQHTKSFPSLVQRIDRTGAVQAKFWHPGHIVTMKQGVYGGKRVMVLGGTNNEHFGASIAVLDYENPSGSAPATNAEYRCTGCPAGAPLEYFVFPQLEFSELFNARPRVTSIQNEDSGGIIVSISDWAEEGNPLSVADVHYTFGPDFGGLSGATGDMYRRNHAEFELAGKMKHRYGQKCEEGIFPVLPWDGERFMEVYGKLGNPPRMEKAKGKR